MGKSIKAVVFTFFMLLFSYSLLVDIFKESIKDYLFFDCNFDMDKKLEGAFVKAQPTEFTLKSWQDGSFQEKANSYYGENIGFRNWLIRINNQLTFTLFGESSYSMVTVGKDNFLFETRYLASFAGNDFIGEDSINSRTADLVKTQQILKALGREMLVIIPPSKPRYYSELLPNPYRIKNRKETNYSAFLNAFKKNGISFIDFNKWFLQLKDTIPFMLIPQIGTHWSNYGAALCADSTLKYLEKSMNKKYNHLTLKNIFVSRESGYAEDDLIQVLNLIEPIQNPPMAKFILEFDTDSLKSKPSVLVISDSFYWNWVLMEIPENLFSEDSQFWYYNITAYRKNKQKLPVKELDLKTEILKSEVVILIAVEPNLRLFPYGFAEKMDSVFTK